ncbi:MAG: Transcription elongation factor [uncultured bacterium]|nr:MAG: Transcription elongation factor [uncultured bacterium]
MNDLNQKILLTKEGLTELQTELKNLEGFKLPQAIERLANAREQGDLAENSEYKSAREDLMFIEGRVEELKDIINRAKVISNRHSRKNIDIGCRVTLHINGKKDVYTIVGEWEADPKQRKISHSSPLGKALLGKKVGDRVEVAAPVGKIVYKIMQIE